MTGSVAEFPIDDDSKLVPGDKVRYVRRVPGNPEVELASYSGCWTFTDGYTDVDCRVQKCCVLVGGPTFDRLLAAVPCC